jgi:hypothetical protein
MEKDRNDMRNEIDIIKLKNGNQSQYLICGDISGNAGDDFILQMENNRIGLVYSDPPWSGSNLKWWRRHAGLSTEVNYEQFVRRWCEMVHPASEIFCEQSRNPDWSNTMLAAAQDANFPPLLERWLVCYKTGNKYLPNMLFHFGKRSIEEDPSGMHGEAMTRTVFTGLPNYHLWVADPCIGKGMTSRMADHFSMNCLGAEINPKRLEIAINWLIKRGYRHE